MIFAAFGALVALHWASGSAIEAWDDSYFFKRIGLHILNEGSASWNVGEGPVYGNTSQLFQLLSLIPLLISTAYYISVVKVMLALTCLLLFVLLYRFARELYPDEPLAVGLAFLMASSPLILLLIHSGMETIPALVMLSLNLYCVLKNDHSRRGTAAVVVSTVLVYLIRPDAVLISIVVVGSYYLLEERRLPWRLAIWCAMALALALVILYLYFGTAFPLSFYLKSRALTIYTDHFANLDMRGKRKNIIALLIMAAPLLYVAGHGKGWWRSSLVLSFLAFVSYHYLSTVEIMSYQARFYLPGLVPLIFAAMASTKEYRARSFWPLTLLFCAGYLWLIQYCFDKRMIWNFQESIIAKIPLSLYMGYGIGATLLLLVGKFNAKVATVALLVTTLVAAHRGLPLPKRIRLHSDLELIQKHINRYTTVRGINSIKACLAEPLHIYHSEIGIPGILFEKSAVTDTAGLMDREIAFEGMNFEKRCQAQRPEVIFLPHRNYQRLRAEIARSLCIKSYTRVVKDSSSPLYIRTDLLADFLPCAREVKDKWIDARLLRE